MSLSIGTFVGITIGLGQIDLGSAPGEPAAVAEEAAVADDDDSGELEQEIGRLIEALGVSFRTSIWGLLFSIGLTIALSVSDRALEARRRQWVQFLDRTFRRGTDLDRLAILHARELDTIRDLSGVVRGLVGDLGSNAQRHEAQVERLIALTGEQKAELQGLGESITQAFEQAIFGAPGRQGLVGVIQGMTDRIAQSQNAGVERIVDDFLGKMSESFGGQFQDLGGSIGSMVEANASYQEGMARLVDRLEAATSTQSQAVTDMRAAVDSTAQTIAQVRGAVEDLGSSAATIRSASDAAKAVLETQTAGLRQQAVLSEEVLHGLEIQAQGWAAHRSALAQTQNDVQAQFDALGAAVRDLTKWHEAVRIALADQIEKWHATVQRQHELTEVVGRERAGFDGVVARLTAVGVQFGQLGVGLQAMSSQLEGRLGEMEQFEARRRTGLDEAATTLQRTGVELGQSLGQYVEAARTLSAGMPDVAELLRGVTTAAQAMGQSVDGARALSAEFSTSAASHKAVRESLGGVAASLEATRNSIGPSIEALRSAAQTLADTNASFAMGTTGLVGAAQAVTTSAKTLQDVGTAARADWQGVTRELNQASTMLQTGMAEYSRQVNSNLHGALKAFDEELRSAVAAFAQALAGLSDAVEQIEDLFDPERRK